jgi:hypothetical protein
MGASRIVTATFVAVGIVIAGANPGCSSASSSGFALDAGSDGTARSDARGDATRGDARAHDAYVGMDAPMMLGMPDAKKVEASISHEAGFRDAKPDIGTGDAGCLKDAGMPGPGPVQHVCIIYNGGMPGDSNNECDGHHDPPPPYPPNGSQGNGYDDNCNGLVDEGCACTSPGLTKTCYLVPPEQTVEGLPVGWCATNSVGTEACSQMGEGTPQWSGNCRGAQPPYANDVCAPGDFNCDGREENPTGESCACVVAPVQCPTAAVVTVPYPPPSHLPLEVNAAPWFTNPADVALATGWTWTLTGGDCDNILPHPTFGIYPTDNANLIKPIGTENDTLGMSMKEHGYVATATDITTASPPGVASAIYPAFSLSGDYLLTAAWTLNGTQYSCNIQVQVRVPGLRAEGCWSTEGVDDDLDLHMAKINNFPQCATSHGWANNVCPGADEDCFYGDCYAHMGEDTTNWGYPSSPASACTGWGSQGSGTVCPNPRLDRDANGLSGPCDPNVVNPANPTFCGPENINVDNPRDEDRFAVGLRFFGEDGSNPSPALSHVNVYCDGVRILSAGYDPTTMGANFPALLQAGGDTTGDMWKVGIVTTHVTGAGLVCDVVPTQSTMPHAARDGSDAYCVDNATLDGANSQKLLMTTGQEPATANAMCFH